jgi:hypothetical protein
MAGLAADTGKGSIEFVLAPSKAQGCGVISPVVSAKSKETPLSASTTRNAQRRYGAGE